jgi:NhaA family Na+:H+ antiporter
MNHRLPSNDLPRTQFLAERTFEAFLSFSHIEAAGGGALLIAAAIALL